MTTLNTGDKATMYHAGTNSYYEVCVLSVQAAGNASVVKPRHANAASDYTSMCASYGMKPEWLGRSFKYGRGKELKIVGLLPNKHKNNVLVEGVGGGKYIMSPSDVIPILSK